MPTTQRTLNLGPLLASDLQPVSGGGRFRYWTVDSFHIASFLVFLVWVVFVCLFVVVGFFFRGVGGWFALLFVCLSLCVRACVRARVCVCMCVCVCVCVCV